MKPKLSSESELRLKIMSVNLTYQGAMKLESVDEKTAKALNHKIKHILKKYKGL